MKRRANSNRMIGPRFALAATTAMAAALLSGCTTASAPAANVSASRAEAALAAGQHSQAITHAEAAVLAEPHNPGYRATLGSAYLDAGRFASAATSFDDAMKLGDNSARTALSLSLALTGQGKYGEAAALLNDWEGEIATADLGLALALAAQPDRGIHLMSNAIRQGDNTPKMRQNLAYAYALAGRWREARVMTEQDVPADQVSDRIAEWAAMAQPEAWQRRVAALLDVPVGVADAGQPSQLALANSPSVEQLAAEASAYAAPVQASAGGELPPLAAAEAPATERVDPSVGLDSYQAPEVPAASSFQHAFVEAPAPRAAAPALQPVAARQVAAASPAAVAVPRAEGSHLVQLGSFASEQGARRAWGIYVKHYPELSGHEMVISEAVVRGKHYWRVSAAGFGRQTASSMCGRVRSGGQGCFAYASDRPLPGAVDSGVRMARRD
ncbi:MAG TPA: tetratricopeptide repeat protein [Croceibacterium sp.]